MGDQKDHVAIQKKETESSTFETENASLETATESIPPPPLQLMSNPISENKEEESSEGLTESPGAFQFSLAGPPEKPTNNNSKIFDNSSKLTKGIAEPFRVPIVQKKEDSSNKSKRFDKPSFRL